MCQRHDARSDDKLACCWKCVSQERDPPLWRKSSWWLTPRPKCRCFRPQPSIDFELCIICGLPLPPLQYFPDKAA